MDWKDVGKGISAIAPLVGTALTGPVGLIFNGAVAAVKALTGASDTDGPAEVQAQLEKLPPEQYVKVKEMELAFKAHMADAGVDLEKIAAGDRASARDMQKATGSWVPGILMMALTVGFFGMLILMWYRPPAEGSKELLLTMIGSLGTAWVAGVTFYYGSSQGSAQLKEIIANVKGV